MPRRPSWIDDLFGAIDAKDAERFAPFIASDGTFLFGNAPAVTERAAIRDAVSGFFASIRNLTHEVQDVSEDGAQVWSRGVVTYVRAGSEWEIVTVIATVEGSGVGRAMLEEVRRLAHSSGAERVWLITTDDTAARSFFEHIGMALTRTHENFVDVVRRAKPSTGGYRDAYEFEWRLGTGS